MKLPTQMIATIETKVTIGGQTFNSVQAVMVDINYSMARDSLPQGAPCLFDRNCSTLSPMHVVDHMPFISICHKCNKQLVKVGKEWASPGSEGCIDDGPHEPDSSQE